MAKATLQLFPYVYLNKDGKFRHIGVQTWRYTDKGDCPDGRIDKDSGNITVFLPPVDIELTGPDDVREQALRILRFNREKLIAEHVNTMTKFQWTEGMLLGLAAPEVLGAVTPEKPQRPPDRDDAGAEDVVVKPPRDDMQQFGDDNHHSADEDDIPF